MKKIFGLSFFILLTLPSLASAANPQPSIYTEQKPNVTVSPDQPEFIIKLKSNPTTGYSWFLRKYDSHFLEPLQHHFEAAKDKNLVGAPGYELWTFKVKPSAFAIPQLSTLRLIYVRPWEKTDRAQTVVFWVSTPGK